MTRLILVDGSLPQGIAISEDPRPWHELVKAIHTGKLTITGGQPAARPARGRTSQRALVLPSRGALAVLPSPPPVRLSPGQYDTIYAIARGLGIDQIALEHGISRRMVNKHLEHLKARLNVWTREELLMRAVELGIL